MLVKSLTWRAPSRVIWEYQLSVLLRFFFVERCFAFFVMTHDDMCSGS
ncbi:hypothetical protein AF72_00915 [Xylella taiwanensis]|uniref:Uncharacterized protein n=1 Tax=Xylella taiwanensis TaxID=1444770 RepID=Z9JM24_9GAMM|nr:hypothetical protein AF72_00915 [Xylella taiwanensis]